MNMITDGIWVGNRHWLGQLGDHRRCWRFLLLLDCCGCAVTKAINLYFLNSIFANLLSTLPDAIIFAGLSLLMLPYNWLKFVSKILFLRICHGH